MSRFLLLFLFLLWLSYPPGRAVDWRTLQWETALFLGVYVLLVAVMGQWARLIARRITGINLHRSAQWFTNVLLGVRLFAVVWFGFGLFFLGWGSIVQWMLGPLQRWPVELPGTLLGTAPALLVWIALWWVQYPAERALREQNLLHALDAGMPVTAPPTRWRYLASQVRLQLLFSVVPVLLILSIHDLIVLPLWRTGWLRRMGDSDSVEAAISLISVAVVFLFAPVLLKRVLSTAPLPDSPLRRRLVDLCRRNRLRYREILLWRTDNHMSNAAVMGILPRFRYILLSDLLLETMTDEQIEAVFAHEVGHIVHRHMPWYVVFFMALMLVIAGPGEYLVRLVEEINLPGWLPLELISTSVAVTMFLLAFGFVSRRFERQADVFAARMVELTRPAAVTGPVAVGPMDWHVGHYGATVFSSALRRVAVINNIPLVRHKPVSRRLRDLINHWIDVGLDLVHNWMHGSIPSRMQYLQDLSADPARTARFDRLMFRVYAFLLLALVAGAATVTLGDLVLGPR